MQQLQSDFYVGKRVFITGHTGFKGAWLSLWLSLKGAIVKGYALPPSYQHGLFDFLPANFFESSVIADIRDARTLKLAIHTFQPDIIFHLAAQPLVRKSYDTPVETYETNVIGTANLLDIVRFLPGKCSVVVVTTDKVYKNLENGKLYTEIDTLGGYDPYSSSKACAEILLDSFRNSFFNTNRISQHGKAVASARAGNVIGGGDWSMDRLVPDIVRAIQQNQIIEIRNPDSVRPWQHVLEPLSGYLKLAQHLYEFPATYSTAYNFGPDENGHYSVGDLVQKFLASFGKGKWKKMDEGCLKHEANLLMLDITKAKTELDWKPMLNVTDTINWTVEWYNADPSSKFEFSIEQIKRYENL